MSDSSPEMLSFEESLIDLEKIVRELDDGRLGLEEALARYEQGVRLIRQCHGQLRDAEQRILTITGVNEEGEPLLQPFQHEATLSTSSATQPGRSPAAMDAEEGAASSRFAREARKKKGS